jgi:hypothetical protein
MTTIRSNSSPSPLLPQPGAVFLQTLRGMLEEPGMAML